MNTQGKSSKLIRLEGQNSMPIPARSMGSVAGLSKQTAPTTPATPGNNTRRGRAPYGSGMDKSLGF